MNQHTNVDYSWWESYSTAHKYNLTKNAFERVQDAFQNAWRETFRTHSGKGYGSEQLNRNQFDNTRNLSRISNL